MTNSSTDSIRSGKKCRMIMIIIVYNFIPRPIGARVTIPAAPFILFETPTLIMCVSKVISENGW